MYLPVEPWEVEIDASTAAPERALLEAKMAAAREKFGQMTKGELKNRRAVEKRKAREMVKEGLEHWHKLFRGDSGKAYKMVGTVKREEGWLEKLEERELCEQAVKARPVRKYDV
jgi:hypothetical protein